MALARSTSARSKGAQASISCPSNAAPKSRSECLRAQDLHALRLLLIEQVSRLQHDAPYMEGPPLSDENNAELAERLLSIVRKLQGDCRRRGEPYATNAAFYGSLGIPAVVFGPGSIAQAHTADEWVPLDEVRQAAEIIYQFIKTWRTT